MWKYICVMCVHNSYVSFLVDSVWFDEKMQVTPSVFLKDFNLIHKFYIYISSSSSADCEDIKKEVCGLDDGDRCIY